MNEARTIIAVWLQKMKLKNPLAFVATIGSLYGYTFFITDPDILNTLLGLAGSETENLSAGAMKIIKGSSYVTGAVGFLASSSTYKDLPENKNKQTNDT